MIQEFSDFLDNMLPVQTHQLGGARLEHFWAFSDLPGYQYRLSQFSAKFVLSFLPRNILVQNWKHSMD
jgi:hypothetical protein